MGISEANSVAVIKNIPHVFDYIVNLPSIDGTQTVILNKEDVPADMIEHEKTVITEQVMNEGKPQEIALKMVNGRINKFYKEICLADQEFIKDSSVNVSTYVKNNGGEIVKFVRFAVGEGIEKKEEDFAQEVMNQVNGN